MQSYKKPNIINIIIGTVFFILFLLTIKYQLPKYTGNKLLIMEAVTFIEAFIVLYNLLPKKIKKTQVKKDKIKYKKSSIIAMIFSVIAVVITVLAGHYILNDEKFNFICFLIVAELLIPFFLSFESKKPTVRELVIIAVLCALAVAGRAVFYAIPQFKPIGAIIIISGACLGAERGFMIGAVSALVSNIFFGHGSWTAFQMLGFGMMGLTSGIVFNKGLLPKTKLSVSVFGAVATIILYGGIVNFSSLLYYPQITPEIIYTTYIVYGLPFDILYAISTAFFLWFISEPISEKLQRIKTKYGFFN